MIITTLESTLTPALSALGLELVFIKLTTESGGKILRVYIDKPGGVTVEDCMRTNRQVNAILAAEFPEAGAYDVEVSSPGLNRPLISAQHYEQFKGSNIKISLYKAIDGQKNFKGVLLDISDNHIKLETEHKLLDIILEDIEKANLIPELRF